MKIPQAEELLKKIKEMWDKKETLTELEKIYLEAIIYVLEK